MFVKPAANRVVRRPDTLAHLLEEGEYVPDGDEFWVRRLRDGDVEQTDPPRDVEHEETDPVLLIEKPAEAAESTEEKPA